MGDQIREVPETSPLIGDPSTGETSIGVYLARERRLRGVSLDELADRTKIPRRSLERMEAGSLDHDPDGFARGFVRAVALELGLNAEEAVMRMLAEPSDSGETAAFASQHGGRWLLVGAGLFACVVLLASVFWGLQSRSPSAANVQENSAIAYRRDAVRSLIEEQANSKGPAAEGSDSVGSVSGENSNPGPDPSLDRIR